MEITYEKWKKLMNKKFSNPARNWKSIEKLDACLEKINASSGKIIQISDWYNEGTFYDQRIAKLVGAWDGKRISDNFIKRNGFKKFLIYPSVELFPNTNPKQMLWILAFNI